MRDDGAYALQLENRGKQCQANTSANTIQVRSRYWHICQQPVRHGGLHECYCGQLFDDLGEEFTWESVTLPTVWTAKETNEPR